MQVTQARAAGAPAAPYVALVEYLGAMLLLFLAVANFMG